MSYLRQPIISVLGHVDHGKTSLLDYIRKSKLINKEAGAITQHIGATEVPKEKVIEIVKDFIPKDKLKIPGLLFIDTPGHKAFTSLRKRGGSISDIGILVVDINEGFKPQTQEAVEILKSKKTPFIVAANKIDLIPGWNSNPDLSILENIKNQREEINYIFEERLYKIVEELYKFNYESDRFDRIEDFTKKITIVPISAKTGEGIIELISTLVGLTQKYMGSKLIVDNTENSHSVILEVKNYTGLGKTIDVILYDGVIKVNDKLLYLTENGVRTTKVKSILKPMELKEIRDSSTKFKSVKEVSAAAGIKLSAPDLEDAMAGMPIITLREKSDDKTVEKLKKELESEIENLGIENSKEGILIKADTIGSLEALSYILKENGIKVRRASIGKLTKRDIIDVNADKEKNELFSVILNFSQKVDPEISNLAKEYGITIISNDVIYKLVDDIKEWLKNKEKEIKRKRLEQLILPVKIKILPNCIFRKSNPAIVGVEVVGGKLKPQVELMTDYGRKVGQVKSIKNNNDYIHELKSGEEAAVSIENLIVGRHAEESDFLYSFMGEENFRKLKNNTDLLTSDEIEILKEIALIMRKENTLWGL